MILIKRSQSQTELVDDFFEGLHAIVDEDGSYNENDYLDIYVQALFTDIYDSTNPTWHNSITSGVIAQRQCKALPNFYVYHVFGHKDPQEEEPHEFLWSDYEIDNNFSSNDPDWVLVGPASTIYNILSDPNFGNENDAQRGDVWVKDISCNCDGRNTCAAGTYNHYGLYFDDDAIIDANSAGDGRLQIAPTRSQDKIVRPE